MATSTRDRLISVAHDMFYKDGFHSVGLDRILADVGVTKTTFYNHFSSKEDLVLEALRMHDRWWRDSFVQILRTHGGDSPRGQLLAVPEVLTFVFEEGEYNGCIFVNVAVEFPLKHDPVHMAAAEHKRSMEEMIRQLGAYAGANDPEQLSQEISMVLEGAYVTRHVTHNDQTVQIARRLVQMLVEKHVPEGSGDA